MAEAAVAASTAPGAQAGRNPFLPSTSSHLAPYSVKPGPAGTITLDARDADVVEILRELAKADGCSIISASDVQGRLTAFLQDVTPLSALKMISTLQGFSYSRQQNVIFISAAITSGNTSDDSVAACRLNYVRAPDLAPALKEMFSGRITADPITNSILLRGSEQEARRLRSVLEALDRAERQITLEAKIIALNRENAADLGINWSWDDIPKRKTGESNTENDAYQGKFKFWRGYSFNFSASLNALLSSGKAKLLATPRIITIPGREASIFIGDHIPVQTEKHDSTGAYTTTEYLDAGIRLAYTPAVSSDGQMITAVVHTEVSTPTLISELRNYKITSRVADTNVRMRNGETLIIGGLINEEEQQNMQKVPLLSNIPVLGALFRHRTGSKTSTEILMLLTPHITEAGSSPAIYSNLSDKTPAVPAAHAPADSA